MKELLTNPDLIDDEGNYPLHLVVNNRDLECIQVLLQAGAQINNCGYAPAHCVALYKHTRCLEELLRNGARIDIIDNGGQRFI